MSTTSNGWIREFPKVEGFYWARRTQTNAPEPKVIEVWQHEGDWYAYRHGDSRDIEAEDFTKSLYEFLGPITPTDTAALSRLREALAAITRELDEMINVVERAVDQCSRNATARIPESRKAVVAARAALQTERQ